MHKAVESEFIHETEKREHFSKIDYQTAVKIWVNSLGKRLEILQTCKHGKDGKLGAENSLLNSMSSYEVAVAVCSWTLLLHYNRAS